ncbi:Predicted arabinose efflux permease, MFS family [Palleronia salina]|uniref:Predicted arabinose efflux permease, MFS family n=1 Tax=Palleronia salina TaxID=313368 RepID=A0A1M6A6S1_9RHOB|nr:MFS transporter [Palleronia salina]SHI32188.1 Predicted arabinose efflux permease, MFS family [Palleronia salina]
MQHASVAPGARTATDWTLAAALFVAGLLAAGQFAKVAMGLPVLAGTFDRPLTAVAFLVSVLGVVGIVGGVLAGGVVAAFGARRVLLACLWLGAALSAVQAIPLPFPVYVALRVIEGVSHLGIVVAAPPLMAAAATDRDRPLAMAVWASFFGVSFALFAVAAPPILATGGMAALTAAHAMGMAGIALVLAARLERSTRAPLRLDPVAAHVEIYTSPRLMAPGLGFVFYTLAFVALVTLLPAALGRPQLAVSLPLIALLGTFGAGPLMRRMAPDVVAALGFVLTAATAILLLAGWDDAALPLFLVMGLVPAASFAMIPDLNDTLPDRARATGCIAQMGNVGTTLGTPVFAAAYAVAGLPGMMAALLAACAAGLGVTLLMRRIVRASLPQMS